MIVDDDPVVVDESIKFSFNNVNNEVVLVNNTSTLSTDTCIYINDLNLIDSSTTTGSSSTNI
jgi:hypothetical protein